MTQTHASQISPEYAAGYLTVLAEDSCHDVNTRQRVKDADQMIRDALDERRELLRLLKWAHERIALANDNGVMILSAWKPEAAKAIARAERTPASPAHDIEGGE